MAAIIAGVVTLLGIMTNTFVTIALNKKNNESQKQLLKDRIQADVISSSRVKWIDEVRKTCSDYISSLIDYYNDYSNSTKKENFVKLSYKMKLYFSNNFNDNISTKGKKDDENLLELYNTTSKEAERILKASQSLLKGEKSDYQVKRTFGNDLIKKFITNDNSNAGKSPFINMMFNNNLKLMLDGMPEKEEKDETINITVDVISLYLKIEWERIKNNE